MCLFAGGAINKVTLNGGTFESNPQAHCISLNGSKSAASRGEKLELVINGCYLTSKCGIIVLNPNIQEDWNSYYINFKNGTLRSTGDGLTGAIENGYSVPKGVNAIRQAVQRDDIKVFTEKSSTNTFSERTYKELIFKNGELISQTDNIDVDNVNESEDNNQEDNNQNENISSNNNEVQSGENNSQQSEETNTGNNQNETIEKDNKLPQTGEEKNAFMDWLTIAIPLGIFWLVSMFWIDHEKKKMKKK